MRSLVVAASTYLLAFIASGCATSASDTPWPTEPDFERLRAEARGQAGPSRQGAEWSPREPEGDELPEEERDAPSTWGGVLAVEPDEDEPLPLRAGTPGLNPPGAPSPSLRPPGVKPPPKPAVKPPTSKPGSKPPAAEDPGDTDEIDSDPFFKDDEEDD